MTSEFTIALHALVFLHQHGGTVSSEQLAENICTNPARVRKVMAPLKKAGFIRTKEGAEGGYELAADPASLTLAEVARGVSASFVNTKWHSGGQVKDCMVSCGMADSIDSLCNTLDELCMEHLSCLTLETFEADYLQTALSERKKKNGIRS